ncbi:Cytochrome oxidase assembly protein 1 [Phaffia rhodozyma]|uniref:Cytochrome oxidase assembly protein 1 n=1 Tax=Phaffia rhodozyma TaxID=264483 RepID=A0A0F7SQP2_PHARH|nr:Cytochrome oxidase assembly protein 1 [Phaffia rhodozyma]
MLASPLVSRSISTASRLQRAAPFSTSSVLRFVRSQPILATTASPRQRVPNQSHDALRINQRSVGKPGQWSHPPRLNVATELKDLPNTRTYWVPAVSVILFGGIAWVLFIGWVTNSEKLTSSVFRQVMFVLRTSEAVEELLGDGVHLEPTFWTGGEPWIEGNINVLKGKADLSFRIKGVEEAGRVYFTSIRPNKKSAFQVIRFKIITDGGVEKELIGEMRGKGYDIDIETK